MKPSVRLICLGIVSVVILTTLGFYLFRPANVRGWSTKREREATLRTDLFRMRHAIDSYTLDKQEPPKSLEDLVNAHYLKKIPIDPFTCKKDWVLLIEDVELSPDQKVAGTVDVHSSSGHVDSDGAAYSTW
jgi:general secretion pathway protein G